MLQLNKKIVLASASPRRQALLTLMDLPFEVRLVNVDEHFPSELPLPEVAAYLAKKKSTAYSLSEDELLITADTVVSIDGVILGKPRHPEEAFEMLQQQSGKIQSVYTGVCLKTQAKLHHFTSHTRVHFKQLSTEEIRYYIDQYRPYDKAGAYGIQEWLGAIAISRIDGSYHNVMGLPTEDLYDALKLFKD